MKKCKFLRKTYLMTCYHIKCNDNLIEDHPFGRTDKEPLKQEDIIEASFSTMLNLSRELGAKLFRQYNGKHIDTRGNEIFKMLLDDKTYVDVDGLFYTPMFDNTMPPQRIFDY